MDSLELRRSTTRRETQVYLVALLYFLCAGVSVWVTVRLWVNVVPVLEPGATGVVVPVAGLVDVGLTLLLLWWATPSWQLVLRPGRPEDVVLTVDRRGLTARDAGYTVAVPWSSIASLSITAGASGRPALVPVASGPVERSGGPLARTVARGLRRGALVFRLEPEDPTPEEVRAGILELSGGSVEVSAAHLRPLDPGEA